VAAAGRRFQPGGARRAAWPDWLAALRPRNVAAVVLLLYVLVFVRGLGWQWWAVLSATPPRGPLVAAPPRAAGAAQALGPPAQLSQGEAAAGAPRAKAPLPATDEPPPRDQTDRYGVYYDAHGVAVMGIDTDPSGVYNVPPGRQVRIGGPSGALYDVLPGGRLERATQVKQWPG
jgi:hypothetical protein